jgi:hypothetical protein
MAKVMTLACTPFRDGTIQITASGSMNPDETSRLIVEITKAAAEAHRMSRQPLPDRSQVEANVPYIEPTAMALSPGPRKTYVLLSLHFGAAEIGIAIAKSDGIQFGRALIAACSDETIPH